MTPRPSPFVSRLDQLLLRFGQYVVPAGERAEWLRSWQAELCFMHSRGQHGRLTIGLIRDAAWLRSQSWHSALSGTALLCLGLLSLLTVLAAVPLFVFAGDGHSFAQLLWQEGPRFVVASTLLLAVDFINAAQGSSRGGSVSRWLRARAFLLAKAALLLLLSFLAGTDLTLPLQVGGFFMAMPMQLLLFVVLALVGLRWSRLEGDRRCKHCLRFLSAPARVGRPSWNFLEYNGTELVCRDGHGLLTIPEIETSWCRSSAWIPQQIP